jgi:hypothetical protein
VSDVRGAKVLFTIAKSLSCLWLLGVLRARRDANYRIRAERAASCQILNSITVSPALVISHQDSAHPAKRKIVGEMTTTIDLTLTPDDTPFEMQLKAPDFFDWLEAWRPRIP